MIILPHHLYQQFYRVSYTLHSQNSDNQMIFRIYSYQCILFSIYFKHLIDLNLKLVNLYCQLFQNRQDQLLLHLLLYLNKNVNQKKLVMNVLHFFLILQFIHVILKDFQPHRKTYKIRFVY